MNKVLLVMSLAVASGGCQTYPLSDNPPPVDGGSHALTRPFIPKEHEEGLFHLSCTDKYPDGHSVYDAFDRDSGTPASRAELAARHYAHAAMASNAYQAPGEKPIFRFPDWNLLQSLTSQNGLSLDVYGNRNSIEDSSEIVIAYRGTDSTNWWANFALVEPQAFKQAFEHLKQVRARNSGAQLVTTGHSLGGAIALNMSLRHPGVEAVVFNPSPRAFSGKLSRPHSSRTVIYEVGEGLNMAFGPYIRQRLPAATMYGNYNFMDYKVRIDTFSPLSEHGIYELARGLTVVAMMRGNDAARRFFVANIPERIARSTDWEHCAPLYVQPD